MKQLLTRVFTLVALPDHGVAPVTNHEVPTDWQ